MILFADLEDPGPCIICGAQHTTCKGANEEPVIVVQMLPMRDSNEVNAIPPVPPEPPGASNAKARR